MMFIRGTSCPPFGSDESVTSVINYSISVDSVCSVDYLFSTEVTDGHGEANENDNDNENENVQWRVCCVRKRTVWGNANYRECP